MDNPDSSSNTPLIIGGVVFVIIILVVTVVIIYFVKPSLLPFLTPTPPAAAVSGSDNTDSTKNTDSNSTKKTDSNSTPTPTVSSIPPLLIPPPATPAVPAVPPATPAVPGPQRYQPVYHQHPQHGTVPPQPPVISPATPPAFTTNSSLSLGQSFNFGSGYVLILQNDGNLVLYNGNTVAWTTNTTNSAAAKFILQNDNNIVLYDVNSQPLWNSQTANTGVIPNITIPSMLTLQNGGLKLIDSSGAVLWSTN